MYPPNNFQDPSAVIQVDGNGTSIVPKHDMQSGGFKEAESNSVIIQNLNGAMHTIGLQIKKHEENIKLLKSQRNKLEDTICDLQVVLGKYHATTPPNTGNSQSEEEIIEQILQHEKSAAGVVYQLRLHHGTHASNVSCTKDVLGIVATLGRVDDDNLSRLLAEYVGVETMLAVVCKTYEGVRALESYNTEGQVDVSSGIHRLGASIGRAPDGRFLVFCLENIRPFCGEFVENDPQRKLDLLKPKLPNGECPPGFIGYAVNMIKLDTANLIFVTSSGYGLRETLLYSLFSRLQVYKSREEMFQALPCIRDGAISLDGGMIKAPGLFSLGNRHNVDVRFPKAASNPPAVALETEKQLKEFTWKKEKLIDDIKREQHSLNAARYNFEMKKDELLKFMAHSAAHASQMQSGPR